MAFKTFSCDICNFSSTNLQLTVSHAKSPTHAERYIQLVRFPLVYGDAFKCPCCSTVMNSFRQAAEHCVSASHMKKAAISGVPTSRMITCDVCGENFNDYLRFVSHRSSDHVSVYLQGRSSCRVCQVTVPDVAALRAHMKTREHKDAYHSIDRQMRGVRRDCNCALCDVQCNSYEQYLVHTLSDRHVRNSLRIGTSYCFQCKLFCTTLRDFRAHLASRRHFRDGRYCCSVCNVSYLKSVDLCSHVASDDHFKQCRRTPFRVGDSLADNLDRLEIVSRDVRPDSVDVCLQGSDGMPLLTHFFNVVKGFCGSRAYSVQILGPRIVVVLKKEYDLQRVAIATGIHVSGHDHLSTCPICLVNSWSEVPSVSVWVWNPLSNVPNLWSDLLTLFDYDTRIHDYIDEHGSSVDGDDVVLEDLAVAINGMRDFFSQSVDITDVVIVEEHAETNLFHIDHVIEVHSRLSDDCFNALLSAYLSDDGFAGDGKKRLLKYVRPLYRHFGGVTDVVDIPLQADRGAAEERFVAKDDVAVAENSAGIVSEVKPLGKMSSLPTATTSTVFDRWYMLKNNVSFSASALTGDIVLQMNFPGDFVNATANAPSGFATFHQYFRGDIEVEVRANTIGFQSGQLILIAVPNAFGQIVTPVTTSSISSLTQYEHAFLLLGNLTGERSINASIIVPYASPWHAAAIGDANSMACMRFYVIVLNTLRTGTGQPNTVRLSVFARCRNPNLMLKRPGPAAVARRYRDFDCVDVAMQSDSKHASLLDTVVSGVGSVVKGAVNYVVPGGGDALASVAGYAARALGAQDAPGVPVHDSGSISCVEQPTGVLSLGFHHDEFVNSANSCFAEMTQKHSIVERCKVWSLARIVKWNTTTVAGNLLFDIPVSPYICTSTLTAQNRTILWSTPLTYFGQWFRYWRGSIRVKIQIVATTLHQGQLFFAYNPRVFDDLPMEQATNLVCGTIAIGSSDSIEFEIPYVQPTDFLYVATVDQWIEAEHVLTKDFVNGTVYVYVQNQLDAATNVSNEIDVNIWVAAGDDFEFHLVRDPLTGAAFNIDGNWECDRVNVRPQSSTESVMLFDVSSLGAAYNVSKYDDVRDLLKRPAFVAQYGGTPGAISAFKSIVRVCASSSRIHRFLTRTWCYVSGAMRFTLASNMTKTDPILFYARARYESDTMWTAVPDTAPHDGDFLYNNAVLWQPNNDAHVSFSLPYKSRVAAVPTMDSSYNHPMIEIGLGLTTDTVKYQFALFESWGDDVQLYMPMALPLLGGSVNRTPPRGQLQKEWIRDLTRENIESNPGPPVDPTFLPFPGCQDGYYIALGATSFFLIEVGVVTLGLGFYCVTRWIRRRGYNYVGIEAVDVIPQRRWIRNLLAEGIEPNPGPPTFSRLADGVRATGNVFESFFTTVFSSLTTIFQSVLDFVKSFKRGVDVVDNVAHFLDACFILATEVCPLITGIYCLTCGGAIATIGLIQLTTILARYVKSNCVNSAPIKPLQERYVDAFDVVDTGPQVDVNLLTRAYQVFSTGNVLKALILVPTMITGFFSTIILGTRWTGLDQYHLYLSRACPDGHWFQTLLASIYFLAHGPAANQAWEREKKTEMLDLINSYERDEARGFFSNEKLMVFVGKKTGYDLLCEYKDKVCSLRSHFADMVIPGTIHTAFATIMKRFSKASRFLRSPTTQPPSVGVWFYSTPGAGKSYLMSDLFPKILAGILDEDASSVYAIPNDEQKHWDHYAQQWYVYFDEALQKVDSEDPFTIIRAISTACMPVSMADLDEKGLVYCSKVFAVASNLQNLAPVKGVHSTEAIARRFERFSFSMSVNTAYADDRGRCDVGRVTDALYAAKRDTFADSWTAWRRILDAVWTFKAIDLNASTINHHATQYCFSQIVDNVAVEVARRREIFLRGQTLMDFNPTKIEWETDVTVPIDTVRILPQMFRSSSGATLFPSPAVVDGFFREESLEMSMIRHDGAQFGEIIERYDLPDPTTAIEDCDYIIRVLRTLHPQALGFDFADAEKNFGKTFTPFDDVKTTHNDFLNHIYQHSKYNVVHRTRFLGFLRYAAMITVGGAALVYLIRTIASVCNDAIKYDFQSYSGNTILKAPKKVVSKIDHANVPLQSDDRHAKLKRATRLIRYIEGDNVAYLHCVVLDAHTFIVPFHFIVDDLGTHYSAKFQISVPDSDDNIIDWVPVSITRGNSRRLTYFQESVDALLVKVPLTYIPYARKIEHFFFSECDGVLSGKNFECTLLTAGVTDREQVDIECRVSGRTVNAQLPGSTFVRVDAPKVTVAGDCGRLYALPVQFAKPILGFHAYAYEPCHLAFTPISFEAIVRARAAIPIDDSVVVGVEEVDVRFQKVVNPYWNTAIELLGTGTFGDVPIKQFVPFQTKFVPVHYRGKRVLDDSVDCDYKPPKFVITDDVHPLFTNAQKYALTHTCAIRLNLHNYVVDHIAGRFCRDVCVRPCELSVDEMINGFEGLNGIVQDTSPGYWLQLGFKDGKHQFFDPLPQKVLPNGELEAVRYVFSQKAKTYVVPWYNCTFVERFERCLKMGHEGIVPFSLWVSTCKDELRPAAKADAGKLRVFEIPGIEFVLLFRCAFGAFLGHIRTHPGFTQHHLIGADKEAVWTLVLEGLSEVQTLGSLKCCATDASKYDGSLGYFLGVCFRDVADRFYDDRGTDAHRLRSVLIDALMTSYLLAQDQIYRTLQGNKSGNPMTDVFNSIINIYLNYMAFVVGQIREKKEIDLCVFDSEVRMLTYGDDVILSIADSVLPYFNGKVIVEVLKSLGVTVTNASKDGEMVPYISIQEATFLKSNFLPVVKEGVVQCYQCPIPKRDIYKELKFRPKSMNGDDEDLRLRCLVTQHLMAHHGREDLLSFQHMLRKTVPPSWVTLDYDTFLYDLIEKQSQEYLF